MTLWDVIHFYTIIIIIYPKLYFQGISLVYGEEEIPGFKNTVATNSGIQVDTFYLSRYLTIYLYAEYMLKYIR